MNPLLIAGGVALLLLVLSSLFTVKQQTIAILERFGKFNSLKGPGLHFAHRGT